ncbi:MAG TPA: outer membrane beta-barrel protein [Vicinamibacterales bacterium]|nr:outer membrane beta-barrel protein [Vicinamibacterales bacterium]
MRAQSTPEGGPDPSQQRVRIGPLWLNPRVVLTNVGVDTNVFDVPESQNPQKDFTATVTPMTDIWMRAGLSWFQFTVREDVVWYQQASSERSANSAYDMTWRAPIGRALVAISPRYLSTRERPGYEIDARVPRKEWGGTAKVEIRTLAGTFIAVNGSTQHVNFDAGDTFLGTNLHDELNRTSNIYGVEVRHQLTPLTSISGDVSHETDRFTFNPLRDANQTSVNGAIKFDPFALIKGSATIGYKDFAPLATDLPAYRGLVSTVDVSYTLLGATRFAFQVKRDISFSFDDAEPYYLQTGFNGSITQQIFGPFDAVVRGGVQHLGYRDRTDAVVAVEDRTDTVRSYGGGIGYHFGQDVRLGFNIDKQTRTSPVPEREYSGLRAGTSLTYGF